MTQALQFSRTLSDDERKKVQAFGESLIAGRPGAATSDDRRINVDAIYGMCAGMGGGKSPEELTREAWDAQLSKYDALFGSKAR